MTRTRLLRLLPLSNRLRWRVIAGLAAVATVAVAGVAVVSYLLAADAERATARQAATAETSVLQQVIEDRPATAEGLEGVLAPASGVDALLLDGDGALVAATGGLQRSDVPPDVVGTDTPTRTIVDGREVLVTTSLSPGGRLVLVFDQVETLQSLSDLRRAVGLASLVVALLLVVVMVVATRRILDPVERTAVAARRLAQGALGTRLGDEQPHMFADLTGAFDEMAAALEQTVQGLREMERRQRRFVADVSHELRTPLQALSTASDLIEPAVSQLEGSPRRAAEVLVAEVRRLRLLVEDLMEISRLDARTGEVEVQTESVDVEVTISQMLAHRGWADRVALEVDEGLVVPTDRRRLDTIVANLVGNALTHGAPPVTVRATTSPDELVVEVTDAGPGIPDEDHERVFERFAKADQARTRGSGSGLGLAIAREHARMLGATLTFTCPAEVGTVFRLAHPVAAHDRPGVGGT